jgi:hypothetical protein
MLLLSLVLAALPLAAQTKSVIPGGLPLPDAPLTETVGAPGLPVSLEPALALPLVDAPLSALPERSLSVPRSAAVSLAPLHAAPSRGEGGGEQVSGRGRSEPPTDAELEKLFDQAAPGSSVVDFFNKNGGFTKIALDGVPRYTFYRIRTGIQGTPKPGPEAEFIGVLERDQEPANRRFLEALGRRTAHERHATEQNKPSQPSKPALPENPLGSGDFWDMASGMHAGKFMLRELQPGTRYHFFDNSPYVASYLRETLALSGADAEVHEQDVMKLERPARPIAVLRAKNAVAYVDGFEDKIEEMADWIAPGGALVLQNDPDPQQHLSLVHSHGELARRLLREGWELKYEFASSPDSKLRLDTVTLTRPAGKAEPRTPQEADRLWTGFVEAGMQAYAAPRALFIMFR